MENLTACSNFGIWVFASTVKSEAEVSCVVSEMIARSKREGVFVLDGDVHPSVCRSLEDVADSVEETTSATSYIGPDWCIMLAHDSE